MTFNVGSGLLTANIDLQRLHQIKKSALPPEMSLWEKIKQFFFSTEQGDALKCIHKLYHHESLKMSEEDVRDTFIELKHLAAPGCRDKFLIKTINDNDIYEINDEVIVSIPRAQSNDMANYDGDIRSDSDEENEIWSDCLDKLDPEPEDGYLKVSDVVSHSENSSDSDVNIKSTADTIPAIP